MAAPVSTRGGGQRIVRITEDSPRYLAVGIQNAYRQAVRRFGSELPAIMQAIGGHLDMRTLPRAELKKANLALALEAAKTMYDGYRSRLPAKAPGYRPTKRLHRALGMALVDTEQMVAGTTDRTISFVNVKFLNEEAKHWWRVNYGAEGPNLAEGEQPDEYTVLWEGTPLFVLRDDTSPAPQSWLPQAFFSRGVGKYFAPLKQGEANVKGGGVRAARFTDLGLESLAHNFDNVYQAMFKHWLQSRAQETRLKTLTISAG